MKFRINLASQPYEDLRRFWLRWGALLAATALFTGVLIYGAVAEWRHTHVINQKIAIEKSNLARLNREEQQDLAILNQPANREVRDNSLVLNNLIHRKQFSWTLIFADLEHIMPGRLHVVSITPQLGDNGEIEVHMVVGGDTRERAIELVQNMEQSSEFRNAQVLNEAIHIKGAASQPDDAVQFEITAQYVPITPIPAATQERSGQ